MQVLPCARRFLRQRSFVSWTCFFCFPLVLKANIPTPVINRGKNVCIFYLVGNCKFGDEKCNYSHSRAALPPSGWWNDQKDVKQIAQELRLKGKTGVFRREIVNQRKSYWRVADKERNNPEPLQRSNPGESSSSKGKKSGKRGRGKKKGKAGNKKKPFGGDFFGKAFFELSDDESDGMGCCGFSHEDVMELMSQGVKPWDSDAEVRCLPSHWNLLQTWPTSNRTFLPFSMGIIIEYQVIDVFVFVRVVGREPKLSERRKVMFSVVSPSIISVLIQTLTLLALAIGLSP